MITLSKFYDLINRNAMVTLANKALDTIYYEGSLKEIPDAYVDWTVIDFSVSNDGEFLFKVKK